MSRMSGNHRTAKADLYQFVFGFRPLRLIVTFMFVFFVMHPVMPAFASEVAESSGDGGTFVADSEPMNEEHTESVVAAGVVEVESEAIAEVSEVVAVTESDSAGDDTELVLELENTVSVAGGGITVDQGTNADTEIVINESDANLSPSEMANQSSGGGSSEQRDAEADSEVTTDEEVLVVPEAEFYEVVNEVTHTSNVYQFSKQQCVSMGAGAYHCFDVAAQVLTEGQQQLRVERDADGDKEIYLTTANGKTHKLTDNRVDDDAPYYDAISDSVVWHRLIDGRYQIISYQDGRETVLSASNVNSMEPNRSGAVTVWQSWINDAWQVVLHDGVSVRTISTTAGQNIAPQVEGDYVIWNVTNGAAHKVAVYEIATGLVSLIDDEEGARVSNPRFVLVYDTRFANGDVITKGYDTETGSVVPLSAAAPVVPEELPSSDQTGEVRALLQNKSTSRDDSIENGETGETNASSTPSTASSTTTTTPNLVASSTTDATVTVPATATVPNMPLTDFDIVVTPYSTTTSSQ